MTIRPSIAARQIYTKSTKICLSKPESIYFCANIRFTSPLPMLHKPREADEGQVGNGSRKLANEIRAGVVEEQEQHMGSLLESNVLGLERYMGR